MGEQLTIQNFGPIKDMTFHFGKVNVFIGDQGTGKSTVVKLLAAINDMAGGYRLASEYTNTRRVDEFGKIADFKERLSHYSIGSYLKSNTLIAYLNPNGKFKFSYCGDSENTTGFDIGIKTMELGIANTFIPADRGAVNLLSSAVLFSLIEFKKDLPGYFAAFGRLYSRIKEKTNLFDFLEIIGVKYKYENEKDYVSLKTGEWILLENASSGVQVNIPALVVATHQAKMISNSYSYETGEQSNYESITFEEPELDCFPETQQKIINYIISLFRKPASFDKNEFYKRIFLTTHSPYILTSLNNLMQAYQAGQKEPDKANEIIPQEYWLNPNDVSAHMLLPDGTCKDIVDREEALIEAGEIDGVSGKLNKEFDELIKLEIRAAI